MPPVLKEPRTKCFTPVEVGDKISNGRASTNWTLVPDASGGYDVYDITCEC